MEHNKLDALFRNMIRNDDTGLNEQEIISKENVWNQLDVFARKGRFHFWKVAAVVLFLLLGGTSWMMIMQQEKFALLQQDFLNAKNALAVIENKLSETTVSKNNNLTALSDNKEPETITSTKLQKEYIEKLIYVRDTIWTEKNAPPIENIKFVRDTIFIKVPTTAPTKWAKLEVPETNMAKKQKQPSKVEFVFGKKPFKKPIQKNNFIINDSGIVEKTEKQSDGLTPISIFN
ncbi:MAG: hypothetical protein GY705_23420 [Bacteroidetes bacterium]|nr:hypothetical protein [Bacteroidota bacterium]